jgi:hypothetical protein
VSESIPQHIKDQVDAAEMEAERLLIDRAPGARQRLIELDQLPPAIRRIHQRFDEGMERSVVTGRMCPHKHPRRAQPTHLFASQPDLRLCEQCAAPVLAANPLACDLCDKIKRDLTVVAWTGGYLTFHTALCDDCYPEGADAPKSRPS